MADSSKRLGRRDAGRMIAAAYLAFIAAQIAVLVPTYLVVRPSAGSILNGLVGTIGLVCMLAMHVYSVARRNATLRRWMRLSWWLHLHIFLGLEGIFLSYLHCLPLFWRHGTPILVNPGMLNLYALTVVFASGVFGRYLFAQVPKTLAGQHLSERELEAEIAGLPHAMPDEVTALWQRPPARQGFMGMVAAGFARGRALRELQLLSVDPEMERLAARRIVLVRQRAVLQTARRIFSTWIQVHRPMAAAFYVITLVHVVLGILFNPWSELW
ncbi:MAG: hypothetical protein AAGA48_03125 [Myxococcota bacterium]